MTTNNLTLSRLATTDAPFIYHLVNMPEWKRYIGERNVNDITDAQKYIEKILVNDAVKYWAVTLKETQIPIGIITFIKRSYLDYYDIGFAFLKTYTGQGYAAEATTAILNSISAEGLHPQILATTVPQNIKSISLLKKLGFTFQKTIIEENEALEVYGLVF